MGEVESNDATGAGTGTQDEGPADPVAMPPYEPNLTLTEYVEKGGKPDAYETREVTPDP